MFSVQLLRVSVHERIIAAAEDFLLQVEKGEEPSEIPLRALLTERLTAAAEEIVGLLEETVAEYEDRVERSEREICRQRRLLDAVLKPEVKLLRADVQQLLESKDDEKKKSSSLDQEDPDPPHIKEEQEEVWTSQEGEQLQGLEEADITKFTFSPDPVKSEDDKEKPQSSHLHQRLTEQMETEADGEDCGGSEPDRNSHPDTHLLPDTDDKTPQMSVAEIEVSCDDWEETRSQSGLNSLEKKEVPVSSMRFNSPDKPFSCTECGKRFVKNGFLETHMRIHTGEKPFSCSVCGKKYTKQGYLIQHMAVHTGETPHSCGVCNKTSVWHSGVECHKCVGSPANVTRCGKKQLNFSECGKRLCYSSHLKTDTGTEGNVFSCSVCARRFTQRGYLIQHMARHTGTVRFRCCVCDKRFADRHELKNHTCAGESQLHQSHTEPPACRSADGEDCGGSEPDRNSHPDTDDDTSDSSEPDDWMETSGRMSALNSPTNNKVPLSEMGCSTENKSVLCCECGKTFFGEDNLKTHMKTHAGEKPFSCSFCDKGFTQKGYLANHMSVHTEEKRFLYCVCGKRFAWRYNLKNHKCAGESSELHPSQTLKNREAEPPASCSKSSNTNKLQIEVIADVSKETKKRQSDCPRGNNHILESESELNAVERPFSCPECDKRFRRKKNLQEHMRIHTGEKPYGCSVCMKYFSCSGSLRKHLRIHTGEKPFVCSVCGNRFTESGHLKVHMRTHTGEKPFSCSVCGKCFTWRQSFNNHMKYHREETRDMS